MTRFLALICAAALTLLATGDASARRRSTPPKEIELTALIVQKVISCHKSVAKAEDQATGGVGSVYKDRVRRRDAALARCGFPKNVVWRDAYATVRSAAADLDIADGLSELRAKNRQVALPFRAKLADLE